MISKLDEAADARMEEWERKRILLQAKIEREHVQKRGDTGELQRMLLTFMQEALAPRSATPRVSYPPTQYTRPHSSSFSSFPTPSQYTPITQHSDHYPLSYI